MLALLRILLETLIQIFLGAVPSFLVSLLGGLAVAALLWLATFPRDDILWTAGVRWSFAGLVSALAYSALRYQFPALQNLIALFATSLVTGLVADLFMKQVVPQFFPRSKGRRRWASYAVWVYFWFATVIGWRHGESGLVFITIPTLLITEVCLFFIAGYILPFPPLDLYRGARDASAPPLVSTFWWELEDFFDLLRNPENRETLKQWLEQHRQALRCLITFALGTNYPYHVVIDEKINERTTGDRTWLQWDEKLIERLGGDAFGEVLAGPGIILTGPDQSVVLSTGLKFKGVKGPGIVFTQMSERPTQVIDLRVQLRGFPVKARTKDGIEIKVFTFTPFQIGTSRDNKNPKSPKLGEGFPYHVPDVFRAISAQRVEHDTPSQVPRELKRLEWYDLPQMIGERAIREIISRYEFDELYAPFELYTQPGQQPPRSQIGSALKDVLESELPKFGLRRAGSGISNLEPVDSRVIKERVEAWKANWRRKIMLRQAAGQSQRLRLIEHARAQAQIDVIVDIGKRIEALRGDGAPVPMDRVVGYFIVTLERLVGKQATRRFLPGDVDEVLGLARDRFEEAEENAWRTEGGNDAQ